MEKSDEYMLANMIQDFGNQVVAVGTNRDDRKFAREQSEKAYERSMSHWHQVNAYNTPEQQMQRFKQAGLNPNLIYGDMANTPATHSVDYQPAKHTTNLPTSNTDHSKYMSAGLQEQALQQQIKYQTQMMEQTVRMNEHQIQAMAIKNNNMEADTGNKIQENKLKVLQHLAKSLNIKYDYGRNEDGSSIMHGNARQWGIKDFDLQAKELNNHSLSNKITQEIQRMSLNERRIWWETEKNRVMRKYRINIDKDAPELRMLQKLVEDIF